jgi:hypothetical protein
MDGFVDRLHALRFLRAFDPGDRALTFAQVGPGLPRAVRYAFGGDSTPTLRSLPTDRCRARRSRANGQ